MLGVAAATGAGLVLGRSALGETNDSGGDELNVALIGAGTQGRNLLMQCLKIPGVRFRAVCDIWPFHQKYASAILKRFGQPVSVHEDWREMLSKAKSLDAAIVATPDWMHAEHAIGCLKAGLAVYCEKPMALTAADARAMVKAAREAGKVLQIGTQRRSDPRYHAARKAVSDITHVNGHWNRPGRVEAGWPRKYELDATVLKKYGYDSMQEFRNWRWWRKYSGGPIGDVGSHQIDVFNWFLDATPACISAHGGRRDYYKEGNCCDNVLAVLDYPTEAGTVRAFYQAINSSSFGGDHEAFLGDKGTLVISQNRGKGHIVREKHAPPAAWADKAKREDFMGQQAIKLEAEFDPKIPTHRYHLLNFFAAVRGEAKASCPAETAFRTAVTTIKIRQAIASEGKLNLGPEDFKV